MKIFNTENISVEVRFGNLGRGKKDRTSDSVILDIEMGMKKNIKVEKVLGNPKRGRKDK